ncbi:hypothetical protein MMC28_011137 [Mycoblastus sanguinarius]|nr:hypothetical protein [Mycoblastus sanguinarius]
MAPVNEFTSNGHLINPEITKSLLEELLSDQDITMPKGPHTRAELRARLLEFYGFTLGLDHDTKLIPFDGWGRHPATLINQQIQSYELNPTIEASSLGDAGDGTGAILVPSSREGRLTLMIEGQQVHIVQWNGPGKSIIAMDKALESALDAAKKGNYPVRIMEAGLGVRNGLLSRGKNYRVIGLKLEGMDQMGFVFCQDSLGIETEDWAEPTWPLRIPEFGDVLLAEKPDQMWAWDIVHFSAAWREL